MFQASAGMHILASLIRCDKNVRCTVKIVKTILCYPLQCNVADRKMRNSLRGQKASGWIDAGSHRTVFIILTVAYCRHDRSRLFHSVPVLRRLSFLAK